MGIKPVDTIERSPPPHWKFRAGTMDRDIWEAVVNGDEYRLAGTWFEPDDVVMDIGAHIGSFAWLAAQHGAGRVECFEPVVANFSLLVRNALPAKCFPVAVWGSGELRGSILPSTNDANTGGADMFGEPRAALPAFVNFDAIIHRPIRFLKLDCEGAEFPILLTSKRLDCIQQIACEYHERGPGTFYEHPIPDWAAIPGVPVWTGDVLAERLEAAGFAVELVKGDEHMGKIFAKRKD